MAAVKFLLCIFCLAFIGSNGMPHRHLLMGCGPVKPTTDRRKELVRIAENEVGVREKTGHNDGEKVEAYLASVHLKKGQPWCSAFQSWVFAKAGFAKPRSGWSPDLVPASRLARSALPGNIIGIYFPAYRRIAHVGMIASVDGSWINSIEGNTNISGSREGDGVYRKKRHIKTIYRMADWVTEREGAK